MNGLDSDPMRRLCGPPSAPPPAAAAAAAAAGSAAAAAVQVRLTDNCDSTDEVTGHDSTFTFDSLPTCHIHHCSGTSRGGGIRGCIPHRHTALFSR